MRGLKSYPAFMVHDFGLDTYMTFTKRSGEWVMHERPAADLYPEEYHSAQLYIYGEWLLVASGAGVDVSKDDGETWESVPTILTDHMWAEGLLPRSGEAYSVQKDREEGLYNYAAEEAPFSGGSDFRWANLHTPSIVHVRWYTSMIIDGTIYVLWIPLAE